MKIKIIRLFSKFPKFLALNFLCFNYLLDPLAFYLIFKDYIIANNCLNIVYSCFQIFPTLYHINTTINSYIQRQSIFIK